MKQTLIIAATLAAALASAPVVSGDMYRMYRCVGDHGETVYSDRSGVGTECREMWIETTRPDSSGWVITVDRVKTAEPARETDHAGY